MNRTYFLCLLRTVPTNTEGFSTVYDCAGKDDLNKGYWNPKHKIGGNQGLKSTINSKIRVRGIFYFIFCCLIEAAKLQVTPVFLVKFQPSFPRFNFLA